MKLLGFLFLLVLALAAVGSMRGWFTVGTTTTQGRANVQVNVDGGKIGKDAHAVAEGLGTTKGTPVEATTDTGKGTTGAGSTVEGRITALDATAQSITVDAGTQATTHSLAHVPITRAGSTIAFTDLHTDMRAKLTFDAATPLPRLVSVMILP